MHKWSKIVGEPSSAFREGDGRIVLTNGPPLLLRPCDWKVVFSEREASAREIFTQLDVYEGLNVYESCRVAVGGLYSRSIEGAALFCGFYNLSMDIGEPLGICTRDLLTMALLLETDERARSHYSLAVMALIRSFFETLPANVPVVERPERREPALSPDDILKHPDVWCVMTSHDALWPVGLMLDGNYYSPLGNYEPMVRHPSHLTSSPWTMVRKQEMALGKVVGT